MRLVAPKSWLGAAAVTLGLGAAALVAGHGVAFADAQSTSSPSVSTAQHSAGPSDRAAGATVRTRRTAAAPASAVTMTTRTTVLTGDARRAAPPSEPRSARVPSASAATAIRATTNAVGTPKAAAHAADRVVNNRHAAARDAVTVAPPLPADTAPTPYGDIGKWMLRTGNEVANWGGVKSGRKTLYEPINVIIVDSSSTTVEESTRRLNAAMAAAGFPAVTIHSTGFAGLIGGITYAQQPAGTLQAYSDANFLLPNNHGRVFGPAPGPGGTGYVWTASFSRERIGLHHLLPKHRYVSFDRAREAVRAGLVRDGATDLGRVDLGNEYSSQTATTGDHDGYATVIVLA